MMTRIPNDQPALGMIREGFQAEPPFVQHAGIDAPGRDRVELIQKVMPSGQVLTWLQITRTRLTPPNIWTSSIDAVDPTGDCGCTLLFPDDALCCCNCLAIVCSRRHSFTCRCGRVYCSACGDGVIVRLENRIVCKACAAELKSSPIEKAIKHLKGLIWSKG